MLSIVWAGDQEITQPWGRTDLAVEPWWAGKNCHWHCGVDVGLQKGTRLHAAAAGTVICVGYGLLGIRVSTRLGPRVHWFVHIDKSIVAQGQVVAAGQHVAYSGDKVPAGGFLTGPHLHFEVQSGVNVWDLNHPATSLDPIPVLLGGFMAQLTDDEQRELLNTSRAIGWRLVRLLDGGADGRSDPYALPGETTMPDLKSAIAKVPASSGATDLAPVMALLQDLRAHPGVQADPTLAAAIAALGKHLGIGSA